MRDKARELGAGDEEISLAIGHETAVKIYEANNAAYANQKDHSFFNS